VGKKGLIFFCFLVVTSAVFAQLSPERAAQARMAKGKWAKAEQSVKKAIRKNAVNAEAKLVYAQWYFSPANPDFHIDSAYQYTLLSLNDYVQTDQRQRERMARFPLDSLLLITLREGIDSAAFERAKVINTELSYQRFLDQFEFARQRDNAIELRDEVSFLDALKANTYESFDKYLNKYPNSHRAAEAKSRYEKLLFEDQTRDGKLKSYELFFKNFPQSPYHELVTQQIFEISTASGKVSDYLDFIAKCKSTTQVKRAGDFAYHIARQMGQKIPGQILSDSLRRVAMLEEAYWVPFLRNGKFGFMDENGKETMPAQFENISMDYLCGNVTNDYLVTSEGIVSRSGKLLLEGKVNDVEDLGFGILWVELAACNQVIHKSGFAVLSDCVDDARIIANQFLAIRKKND